MADIREVWQTMSHKRRKQTAPPVKPIAMDTLTTIMDFHSSRVVLDPWASTTAVEKGLRDFDNLVVVTNDKLGTRALQHEPLEPHLYGKVKASVGEIDVIVSAPPPIFADAALVTALQFARAAVCLYVPRDWVKKPSPARLALIRRYIACGTYLYVHNTDDHTHCWVCFFTAKMDMISNVRDGVDTDIETAVVMG
jgi:hypothetical protein